MPPTPGPLSPAEATYVAFWERFTWHAAQHGLRYRTPPGHRQNWYGWGVGRKATLVCVRVAPSKSYVSVLVSIGRTPERDEIHACLARDKAGFEARIGAPLRWQEDTKEIRVLHEWHEDLDEDQWDAVMPLLLSRLSDFEDALRARLATA
ncbi:MAG: DUF4268 domain-containing protein [Alphaproteobacteria bacterium]|nr:DUF4268 domain-containing protein [Alphaproteobacteria bacterium]